MTKEISITITAEVAPSDQTESGIRVLSATVNVHPEEIFVEGDQMTELGVGLMAGLASQGLTVAIKTGEKIGFYQPKNRNELLRSIIDKVKTELVMTEDVRTHRR